MLKISDLQQQASVAELEQQLARAREAERQAQKTEAQRQKDWQHAETRFLARAGEEVEECETRSRATIAQAQSEASTVITPDMRVTARAWLRGGLGSPGELLGPDDVLGASDPVAAQLLGVVRAVQQTISKLFDMSAEHFIRSGEPVAVKADTIEVEARRAFLARVRAVAGED